MLLRSPLKVGALPEPRSVLLRSKSQGRLVPGAAISHHPCSLLQPCHSHGYRTMAEVLLCLVQKYFECFRCFI